MITATEYTHPVHQILIGGKDYAGYLESFRVSSSRLTPSDIASLVLGNEKYQLKGKFSEGQEIQITAGYKETGSFPIFTGYIERVSPGVRTQIQARDAMIKLKQTLIIQSWRDKAPEDLLKEMASQAGINQVNFVKTGVKLPFFQMANESVLDAFAKCNETLKQYGIDTSDYRYFFDIDGMLHWGPFEEVQTGRNPLKGKTPVFQRGVNIISHTPAKEDNGLACIETILIPELRHSQLILIQDNEYAETQGLFRVERCEYASTVNKDNPKSRENRMRIWYREIAA